MTDYAEQPVEQSVPPAAAQPPAETPVRLGFLDLVYGVLLRPGPTLAAAAGAPPFGAALLLVTVVAVLQGLVAGAGSGAVTRGLSGLILMILGLAVSAAGLGLFAELLGGRGRVLHLFALLALTRAPQLLVLPLTVLGRAWAPLNTLAAAVSFLWGAALAALAVRSAYRMEAGTAIGALVLGAVAAVLVPIVLLVVAFAAILSDPTVVQSFQSLAQ